MILAVAATQFEMSPFLSACENGACVHLLSGVGPVESCLQLTRYLQGRNTDISLVVNFGVAGAYPGRSSGWAELLDICVAESEVFGDLGICFPRRIDELAQALTGNIRFSLDSGARGRAIEVLKRSGIKPIVGNFVTVNCASGTRQRGEMLRQKHDGLCENMEGAAIARVCAAFDLPLLQLRCISNYVEDRDLSQWRLQQACERGGESAARIINERG